MNKREIAVAALRPGMFVSGLDRPWLGLPFALEGFSIVTDGEIRELSKYCRTVVIDLDREVVNEPRRRHAGAEVPSRRAVAAANEYAWSAGNGRSYVESTPVEKELAIANTVYSSLEQSVRATLGKMRQEGELNPEVLKNAVGSVARSIERNPDAMMLLSKMRAKSRREFDRAIDTSIHMITFGRFLQLSGEQLELLGLAGLLLDIGKINVPDGILKKQGVLTDAEFALAKTHVMQSVEMIRAATELPPGLGDIVLQHHERLDGSGYPRGLRGDQLTTGDGIAGMVDSYSALTSIRPYAVQASPSSALSLLHKLRGTLFDAVLVEKFIQCIGIYPVGSAVELNTGEIAIVIAQNQARRLQPRVMVIFDSAGTPLPHLRILDLIKEPKATADELYRIRRTLPRDMVPIDREQILSQVTFH